jgi:hypothetical protein
MEPGIHGETGSGGESAMLEATHESQVLRVLGVPVASGLAPPASRDPFVGCARLWLHGGDTPRELIWLRAGSHPGPLVRGAFQLGSIPIFGQVWPDAEAGRALAARREGWKPATPIVDREGAQVGSVWHADDGSVFLPFDPDELELALLSEGYLASEGSQLAGRAEAAARYVYYRLRPLMPRALQIGLRRAHGRVREGVTFPRWPIETARHDLHAFLLGLVAETACGPVPWIAPWPRGRSWALVLTHDVETSVGHDNVHLMRELEESAGFRSSWNFVPERYPIDAAVLRGLGERGFEVGVHGLRHDGRDLESMSTLRKRLPEIRRYAELWGAVGFRAPATQRGWDMIPILGFDYDSSYPDTDPYEPQRGGCCSWLPFFNRDTVELPITLPQDHTLFVILGQTDETAWLEKMDHMRDAGGMALLITHPDYMLDESRLGAYSRLLAHAGADENVWRALPREVSAWWRRRAASQIELVDGDWQVVGPASDDAEVRFIAPG